MEDLFYMLRFKQVLLGLTVIIYLFVLITLAIKLLVKSEDLENVEEKDDSDVEQIFGVHTFNQDQKDEEKTEDDNDSGDVEEDDMFDDHENYFKRMTNITKNIMEESEDGSGDN